MKNTLVAAALAVALVGGAASTASAATFPLLGTPFNDQATTAFKRDNIAANTSFTDIYTFSLNGASGTAAFSLTNVGRTIAGFVGKLYKGVFDGSQTAIATTNLDTTRPQQEDFSTASNPGGDVAIGSGVYSFVVTGTTPKGGASSYSGTGYFQVSAVPLPSTVAMFGTAIFGLGVFGAMRKKKASAAA